MKQRHRPKAERLAEQVTVGLHLHEAFGHPAVIVEIQEFRDSLIDAMALCEPLDDDGRRSYALQVQALDTITKKISGKIGAGERAAQELAKMEQSNG